MKILHKSQNKRHTSSQFSGRPLSFILICQSFYIFLGRTLSLVGDDLQTVLLAAASCNEDRGRTAVNWLVQFICGHPCFRPWKPSIVIQSPRCSPFLLLVPQLCGQRLERTERFSPCALSPQFDHRDYAVTRKLTFKCIFSVSQSYLSGSVRLSTLNSSVKEVLLWIFSRGGSSLGETWHGLVRVAKIQTARSHLLRASFY